MGIRQSHGADRLTQHTLIMQSLHFLSLPLRFLFLFSSFTSVSHSFPDLSFSFSDCRRELGHGNFPRFKCRSHPSHPRRTRARITAPLKSFLSRTSRSTRSRKKFLHMHTILVCTVCACATQLKENLVKPTQHTKRAGSRHDGAKSCQSAGPG